MKKLILKIMSTLLMLASMMLVTVSARAGTESKPATLLNVSVTGWDHIAGYSGRLNCARSRSGIMYMMYAHNLTYDDGNPNGKVVPGKLFHYQSYMINSVNNTAGMALVSFKGSPILAFKYSGKKFVDKQGGWVDAIVKSDFIWGTKTKIPFYLRYNTENDSYTAFYSDAGKPVEVKKISVALSTMIVPTGVKTVTLNDSIVIEAE